MQTQRILQQPSSHPWHIPDLFVLSVLPLHRKLNISVFNSFKFFQNVSSGSRRFNSKWVILERTKDFITVILPKGVRFLLDQTFKTFLISFSLFSKFIGTISRKLVENMTIKPLNVAGFQLRPYSGINFTCEFLRDPIQTETILSKSIIRPDTEANFARYKMIPFYHREKKLYHLQIVQQYFFIKDFYTVNVLVLMYQWGQNFSTNKQ